MTLLEDHPGRHEKTQMGQRWLEPNPNLPAPGGEIAEAFAGLTDWLLTKVPDCGELSRCLDALVPAKDWAVRAGLRAAGLAPGSTPGDDVASVHAETC